MNPRRLVELLADAATAGVGRRVGIEGPVADDAHALADALADELADRAVPVARVCADDFLRARSLRLEHGRDDPEAFAEGWYDLGALRREVLDPMAPDADPSARRWLPRLRNPASDRPYREPARAAAATTVVVLDGRFLARWEIADALDVRILLDVSPAARARRVPADEQAQVLPAWEQYLLWYDPVASAAVVVRYDRPSRPALLPGDR